MLIENRNKSRFNDSRSSASLVKSRYRVNIDFCFMSMTFRLSFAELRGALSSESVDSCGGNRRKRERKASRLTLESR